MILTGTYHFTAAVNPAKRRIVGQVLQFGEEGSPGASETPGGPKEGVRLVVEAGGLTWDDDDLPKLTAGHGGPIIGKAVTMDASEAGIFATFKIAATHAGDDALALAADGLTSAISFEASGVDVAREPNGVYRLTARSPAALSKIALVEKGAFRSAQVLEVAATDTPPTPGEANQKDTTMSDTTSTASEAAVTTEVHAEAAPAPAPPVNPVHVQAASTKVVKEPFPYGFDGSEGRAYFTDMIASHNDNAAAARVRKAQSMWAETGTPSPGVTAFTAADEPVLKTNTFIPNAYQPELYVGQIRKARVIADAMPLTAISNSRPVPIPKFTSSYADGGSGEMVAAHSEGSNPTSGEIVIGSITATPAPYSGVVKISRQALDAADPTMDGVIFGALMQSWANTTEAAAVTALLATSGAATASSTTDASLEVEARNMFKVLRKETLKFYTRRAGAPDVIFYAPEQFDEAVAADGSTSGLPLYPEFNPTNSQSALSGYLGTYGGPVLSVLRVPGVNAPLLTAAKVVMADTSDLHRWESPLQNWKWEEVGGPDTIKFVVYTYGVFAGLQGNGVTIVTQS